MSPDGRWLAAIGIGIVDKAMTFQAGNRPAYNDAVLFGIVLVGLLVAFFHPWLIIGMGIDVALVWAVLLARWEPGLPLT